MVFYAYIKFTTKNVNLYEKLETIQGSQGTLTLELSISDNREISGIVKLTHTIEKFDDNSITDIIKNILREYEYKIVKTYPSILNVLSLQLEYKRLKFIALLDSPGYGKFSQLLKENINVSKDGFILYKLIYTHNGEDGRYQDYHILYRSDMKQIDIERRIIRTVKKIVRKLTKYPAIEITFTTLSQLCDN